MKAAFGWHLHAPRILRRRRRKRRRKRRGEGKRERNRTGKGKGRRFWKGSPNSIKDEDYD